jgi:hypothetical protein
MAVQPREIGAVALDGSVVYELLEHERFVELRHTQEREQYILIDREALPGIASILLKAAEAHKSNNIF